MKKILKCQKGMTLMELVVGMLIFSVVMTSVTAILAPALKAYAKANDLAEANALLDNLSNEILNDLWSATEVNISGTSSLEIKMGTGGVVYDVSGGYLYRGTKPVLDKGYYKGKTVSVEYYEPVTNSFIIRLKILSEDGAITSRDYAVKPLGLNLY